jgi:hypothetical protein
MKLMTTTIAAILLFALSMGYAQEEKKEEPVYGWQNELVGNLNFTQTMLDNWTQGGEDSWVWQLDINGKAENDQKKFNWANTGKISYGKTKIQDSEARKSADEIRLESVYTYKVGTYVNPYVAVSGITQLTSGYVFSDDGSGNEIKTEVSKFLNPGYFTESIGVGFKKSKHFKTRLGLAFKQTVATDEAFAPFYSDDPDTPELETVRSEVGMESVSDYSRKISETILYTSKLELFSNFESADAVDVRWDNLFSAKVSKLISVSFNLQLFYDKDISPKRQLKQVLAAGLTYSFL